MAWSQRPAGLNRYPPGGPGRGVRMAKAASRYVCIFLKAPMGLFGRFRKSDKPGCKKK